MPINSLKENKEKNQRKQKQKQKSEKIWTVSILSSSIIISLELIEKESGTGSESSTSQEDEDAELINDEFESTFLKTLAKLRNKDPEIYEPDKIFFESIIRIKYESLSYNFQ